MVFPLSSLFVFFTIIVPSISQTTRDGIGACPRVGPLVGGNGRQARIRCQNVCSNDLQCSSGLKCCLVGSCRLCIEPIPTVTPLSQRPQLEVVATRTAYDDIAVRLVCHGHFDPYVAAFRWYRNGRVTQELHGVVGSSMQFKLDEGSEGLYSCAVNKGNQPTRRWAQSRDVMIQERTIAVTTSEPCPPNSSRRPCGCQPKCGSNRCQQRCKLHGICICDNGYAMHEGKCIPVNSCPKPCQDPNEHRTDCGFACTCRQYLQNGKRCSYVCADKGTAGGHAHGFLCLCRPGFIRQSKGGKCIPIRQCERANRGTNVPTGRVTPSVTTDPVSPLKLGSAAVKPGNSTKCHKTKKPQIRRPGCTYKAILDKNGCQVWKIECNPSVILT